MLKDKGIIRKEVLRRRDSISSEIRKAKDISIEEKIFTMPEFVNAYKILLYASFRSEVNTINLIKYCITNNKVTALPRVDKESEELLLYEIKDVGELVSGYFGIPEPDVPEDRRMHIFDMDIVIVPGVAFDDKCGRLGYGKGFYDKLLMKLRTSNYRLRNVIVALAYEEQIVESLPLEEHDIRMDKIITDKRIISCNA